MTACCGFEHREVLEKIDDAVYAAVLKAAERGCDIFYTGAMGEFDSLFSSAVRKVKKTYPKIKLICVKPYFTNDLNINGEYYSALYDDVIIPDVGGYSPQSRHQIPQPLDDRPQRYCPDLYQTHLRRRV